MADRRVRVNGRVPHVGNVPRARRQDGGWYRKRSDTGKSRNKSCFIATACYGIDSKEVKIFKEWRDNTLIKNKGGRAFIGFYYKTSPSITKFISNKPKLIKLVKRGLNSTIKILENGKTRKRL